MELWVPVVKWTVNAGRCEELARGERTRWNRALENGAEDSSLYLDADAGHNTDV